jgi:hypothetical protein
MYNHQHLQINILSKLTVIVLSIALIIRISFVPRIQLGVYRQIQQQIWCYF